MSIRVTCSNGHVLKVKNKYAGKSGVCPMCKEPISVPAPEGEDVKAGQSGLSGLALQFSDIKSKGADPLPDKNRDSTRKICAKCQGTISNDADVCPHCKAFIAKL